MTVMTKLKQRKLQSYQWKLIFQVAVCATFILKPSGSHKEDSREALPSPPPIVA